MIRMNKKLKNLGIVTFPIGWILIFGYVLLSEFGYIDGSNLIAVTFGVGVGGFLSLGGGMYYIALLDDYLQSKKLQE